VRPRLSLDEYDLRWLEAVQVAADHRREIERRIRHSQSGDVGTAGDRMASRRSSRKHKAPTRVLDLPRADELERKQRFPDADCMNVDGPAGFMLGGQ
jgi:hypothetical protein